MRAEPPASLVDWGVLGAVAVLLATGVAGLGLPVLLVWKLRRVRGRLAPGEWTPATLASVAALVLTLAALATGLYWTVGGWFTVGAWTGLTVHALLGLLVAVPLVVHLVARFRRPRTDPDAGRRAAIGYSAVAAVGLAGYAVRKRLSAALGTLGRFTGSKRVGGAGNDFPATSWVADDPDPVDRDDWTLTVTGAVESRAEFDYSDLAPADADRALLDCTSGWYTTRDWRGVRTGRLLAETGVTAAAGWVTYHSVTGYRWTLPLAEARDALLATHVGDERLSHGHGFPLRLVAPGRRGFQWVKWVTRIEVRATPDYGQWVAIFTSGFD